MLKNKAMAIALSKGLNKAIETTPDEVESLVNVHLTSVRSGSLRQRLMAEHNQLKAEAERLAQKFDETQKLPGISWERTCKARFPAKTALGAIYQDAIRNMVAMRRLQSLINNTEG